MFVGSGAAVTAVTGLAVPPGGQLTLQGYVATSVASNTGGDISAITSAGTASALVGLASVASNV
jgi:hypothetical protein